MPKEKFKLRLAVYLVLVKNRKILLLRRFNTGYEDGNYSFIAGHVDGGETIRQAIKREAEEEAGIKLNLRDIEIIHFMHRRVNFPEIGYRERISVFTSVKKWRGQIKNLEPHKCDELSWFPLDNLPKNTIPYIKFAIDNIKKKIIYSEFGW